MGSFKPNIAANADNAIVWENGRLYLLDQRALPAKTEYIGFDTPHQVADAIRQMIVRGAPAIGIAAAYGVVLGARIHSQVDPKNWKKLLKADVDELAKARPTAVNLGWALERMSARLSKSRSADPVAVLLAEATAIHTEDRDGNRVMGDLGAKLIAAPTTVITHCNAGALATGGYGTALGVIRSGVRDGKITHVFADETRPWMQGARLTAWELLQDDIPVTLIADSAAAYRMAKGGVGWVIVGADRVVANGDVANKIGTYALAVAAKYHGIKVMVAAPTSTIDMRLASGDEIPIEERDAGELLGFAGMEAGSPGAGTWNPVFDITPAGLIDALVTEKGVVRQPNRKKLEELMA